MKTLRILSIATTALVIAAASTGVQAADAAEAAYPSKPIRIIIPFPPGGGTDSSTRFLAQKMTEATGQAVIVENKPGANGFIAAQAAVQAPADGYTVFVTTMTTQSVNPHIFKKLPYDPLKDFIPVTFISSGPMLLVVRNAEGQPKSLAELTDKAKRQPGKLSFASGNMSSRVAGEVFGRQIGGNFLHVPYKGAPEAMNGVLAGEIDLMFPDLNTAAPLIKQGKLRALGVTGTKRMSSIPDVKTMEEQGFQGMNLVPWSAAYLPAKTPRAIVDRLSELMMKILGSPAAKEFYSRFGADVSAPLTPDQTAAFARAEFEIWGKAVRSAGVEPE